MNDSTFATIRDPTKQARWQGHATPEGTAEYASGRIHGFVHAPGHFRQFAVDTRQDGGAALTLSSLGTGTYLGDPHALFDELVENALIRCVGDGWNVIDTAPFDREGRGERCVGTALKSLRLIGGCRREHLFISTKVGLAADPYALPYFVSKFGSSDDGEVTKSDLYENGQACWHPEWLKSSLNRSIRVLKIETIDMLYLHHPAEILLPHVSREEFWDKMKTAFQFCEQAKAEGKIMAYGLATWDCFRVPPDHKLYVSLEQVVKLAEEVSRSGGGGGDGSSHGFRAIKLPVNTGMFEAFLEKWQSIDDGKGGVENVTLLEAAKKLGIAVFGTGPLERRIWDEIQLLDDDRLFDALEATEELIDSPGLMAQLLQIARSVPGVLSVMIGNTTRMTLDRTVALTKVPPLTEESFLKVIKNLPASVSFRTTTLH